jgi:chemotaxis protein histidine kinase CheA
MEMQQMLLVKANEAIAALWLNQLKTISNATGVGMDVLYACLDMQVPTGTAPEKKKRAPPKKKEDKAPVPEQEEEGKEVAAAAAPEKKKRAPPKKKTDEVVVPSLSDESEQATAVAPKKRAPPKKKELVISQDDTSVAISETSVAVSNTSSAAEEKKAKKDAEALEKKMKKELEALEKKMKKEAEALEKKAKKEAEALEKAAKKDTKKAPAKKATKKKEDEQKKPEIVARFKEHDQVRYLRPTGKTVDAVVEYVIKYDDYVEYKLQVIGKNETILSREETTFSLDQIPNDPEDESDDEDDADTVIMPESAPSSRPRKQTKRPDVFLKNTRINVERVNINGTSYLIGENDIAFLESSKKMVGKYDSEDHSIRQLLSSEYDEYYGPNTEYESDEDECPDMSDMSSSESDSESESE